MIGRLLRSVPAAIWAALPGLAVCAWWAMHVPETSFLEGEVQALQRRLDLRAEHQREYDEVRRSRVQLTIEIELIQEAAAEKTRASLHRNATALLHLLPPDLGVERLLLESPAWQVQIETTESDRAALESLATRLGTQDFVKSAVVADGGSALELELDPLLCTGCEPPREP